MSLSRSVVLKKLEKEINPLLSEDPKIVFNHALLKIYEEEVSVSNFACARIPPFTIVDPVQPVPSRYYARPMSSRSCPRGARLPCTTRSSATPFVWIRSVLRSQL